MEKNNHKYKEDKKCEHNHEHNHEHSHEHGCSFTEELVHHFPYAIISVACGMIVLSLINFLVPANASNSNGYHSLFHSFHFLHILFAATGAIITFSRFSNNLIKTLLVGIISPAFFCILSDVFFPFLAGKILGADIGLHICFHEEWQNVLPFLIVGILNGLLLRRYGSKTLALFSVGSHFAHILISSLAGLFYMVSHGFSNWYPQMGMLYLLLIFAIVIPCTLSDVIVPMYFAGDNKK